MIKTLVIIHPILEQKKGVDVQALIQKHLDHGWFDPVIRYSEYPGHASMLARENAGNCQLVVAAGGDGTINQVAKHLVHTKTVLGVLPLGAGNGLARSLGMPLNIREAIKFLNNYHVLRIDTGLAGGHRFFNIAGIGFAAKVAHGYSLSRKRGFLSYAMQTVETLTGFASFPARIRINDRNISGRFFIISFANARQWGYGAYISPLSKPDDGWLDLCLIKRFPGILFPCLLTRLFGKTIHRSRYFESIPLEHAVISGNESFTGHTDGEPVVFNSPLSISVEKVSLNVICQKRGPSTA